MYEVKEIKQNKTKQNKTKQNKTKQNKTKRNKTKQNKTKQKTARKCAHVFPRASNMVSFALKSLSAATAASLVVEL
jgi:hypothetical protein